MINNGRAFLSLVLFQTKQILNKLFKAFNLAIENKKH
jgi:hypothetical protein